MSFGALCSFTPSDPHNVSLLLGSLVAGESSEVATPTTGRYWRQLLSMASPCLQRTSASGERQGLRSRCNEWPAEVDWNCSLYHVEDVFAPSYLVLASTLALWPWGTKHSSLLRPLDHSPRPKAFLGCCHSDPFMHTFQGTSRASILFTILVRGNSEG